jgi:hypothetical protein
VSTIWFFVRRLIIMMVLSWHTIRFYVTIGVLWVQTQKPSTAINARVRKQRSADQIVAHERR